MFDKEAQRLRAEAFSKVKIDSGVKAPVLPAIVVKTKTEVKKEPKAKKLSYEVLPFTNDLGQVIQPGQKVIAVTSGFNHSTKIALGTYLGSRSSSVVVRVLRNKSRWVDLDGNPCTYYTPKAKYVTFKQECQASLPSKRIYPTV
jgi:Tfp pilus assembly protein PilP